MSQIAQYIYTHLPEAVCALAVIIFPSLQAIKAYVPYLNGWKAVGANFVLAIIGVFAVTPPGQFWTAAAWAHVFSVAGFAAGLHGVVANMLPGKVGTDPDPAATAAGTTAKAASAAGPALAVLLCISLLGLVGCSNFDRDTFNTLAVSNSVLKTAQADYESGKLPHNACAFALITKGKTAQGIAETAFLDYYTIEQAKGDVTSAEAAVVTDLTQIAPIVASIQSLYKTPNSCPGA